MDRLTDLCLRHRVWVVVVWVLLAVGGMATAGGLAKRLDQNFSLPGQKAYEVNQTIEKTYGTGGNGLPVLLVVTDSDTSLTSAAARTALTSAFTEVAKLGSAAPPDGVKLPAGVTTKAGVDWRVYYPGTPGAVGSVDDPTLVSSDGHAAYGVVLQPEQGFSTPDATQKIGAVAATSLKQSLPGATVHATSYTGLQSGGNSGGAGVFVELLIGAVGALAILAFVFGSFLALMPLLMAITAILTTYLLVTGLTTFSPVSAIAQFLIPLIGLGVAIDYALLVVTRWREERGRGGDEETAVRTAMQTAGHSVVFSGVTVAVGLFSLIFLPVPFLRSLAFAGMLVPLISVLVAVTLLPILLLWWGPFLDKRTLRKHGGDISGPWSRWARLVVRRRWAAAVLALAVLGALVGAASTIQIGEPKVSTLAKSGDAFDALQTFEHAGFPVGALSPIEVLVPNGDGAQVAAAAKAVPGISTAFVSGTKSGAVTVEVVPSVETYQSPGTKLITAVDHAVEPLGGEVGGAGAGQQAFIHAVYGTFPLMLGVIVVLTFLLLARAFRSLLLPLKAVILNLISVGAAYGVLVLVWQKGYGSSLLWSTSATGAITSFVPLMVFAFLFGLSMDYEVFILARMREEHDAGRSTDASVVEGIGRTGRLVTSAALILFLAFVSLSSAPGTDIRIFATGLGAGILLDATVVRALLVPALVSLFGRWNWVLPDWAAKVLFVQPSPLTPPETRRPTELEPV